MYIAEAITAAISAGTVAAVAPGLLRKLRTTRTPKPDEIHNR